MTFQRGNQLARKGVGATKSRFLTQALISELNEMDPSENMQRFRVMVRRLVDRACRDEPDFAATVFIMERIEGKAPQSLEVTNKGNAPAVINVNMTLQEAANVYAQAIGDPDVIDAEAVEVSETADVPAIEAPSDE
jgi:hypothetical protein